MNRLRRARLGTTEPGPMTIEADFSARDKAWARLVKAERSAALYGAYDEVDAARQALRDLGVDVDALMAEDGR